MDKTLVNQLAQLFVFGVRVVVSKNAEDTGLGKTRDHLHLLQKQLDVIMDKRVLPGHVVRGDEEALRGNEE